MKKLLAACRRCVGAKTFRFFVSRKLVLLLRLARGPFVAPYVARIVKVRRSHPPSKIFCGFKVNEVLARRDVGRGPGDREIFLN